MTPIYSYDELEQKYLRLQLEYNKLVSHENTNIDHNCNDINCLYITNLCNTDSYGTDSYSTDSYGTDSYSTDEDI